MEVNMETIQNQSKRHFEASNMEDLIMFRKAFYFSPDKIASLEKEVKNKVSGESEENALKSKADLTFNVLPEFYDKDKVKDWNANLQFKIDNIGDYTLEVKDGKAVTKKGLHGTPTCVISADIFSLNQQLALLKMEASKSNDELSDVELEAVAGGKRICGGEACGIAF